MPKRKVKIAASELTDVDVDLISLVHRPASRIPFGLMKSDSTTGGNQMFDLSNIFKREETVPVVTSVIVKGEASAKMLAFLKAEGFAVEEVQQIDGVSVYPQDVPYVGDVSVVKLTEELAVTVPLVKGEGSFAEMCASRGFYPSLNIATELLQHELYRAVEKSDSPSAASQKVNAVISDFGQFMSSLVGGLPTAVFKTEEAILKMDDTAPVSQEAPEGTGEEAPAQEEQAAEMPEQAGEVEAPEGEQAEGEQVEKADDEGSEEPEAPAAPAIDFAALSAAIAKSVTDSIAPELSQLREGFDAVSQRLTEVENISKSAVEATHGTVLGGVFNERGAGVKKTEAVGAEASPLIDTGFEFRRNR